MRRLLALLALWCLLPCLALGEGCVINLIETPDQPWAFEEGAEILEVVFPPVYNSDACILRCGDETMMVDASTRAQRRQVARALTAMGITRVDTAFNSHPHNDHLSGFQFVPETAALGRLVITFWEKTNDVMINTVKAMRRAGVPVTHAGDGDVMTLGGATLTVIQRDGEDFNVNDRSALLLLRYGERTMLLTGDIECRAQAALAADPPACGLKADILKYPHHGLARMDEAMFEAVAPAFCVITDHVCRAKAGFDFLTERDTAFLSTWERFIRLRTDGTIWVLDELPMEETR